MIGLVLKFFRLLTKKQKRELLILQFFMLASSVAELVGTVSIVPFIALAAEPNLAHSNPYLEMAYKQLGQPSDTQFLIAVGLIFLGLMVLANLTLLISQFLMNRYSFRVGGEISTRLYNYYLSRDILFHSKQNSALLIQRIMRDSTMLSTFLIAPTLRLNARIFSIVLLASLVVFVDPYVALVTVSTLAAIYFGVFHLLRTAIHKNGDLISRLGQKRNQRLNESFGGIREVKLYSSEHAHVSQYRKDTKLSDRAAADNLILGETPYFLIEIVVFAGMIALTIYLSIRNNNLGEALPYLTLFALAGIKMVPKVQQCYQAIAKIKSAEPIAERVLPDLEACKDISSFTNTQINHIIPKKSIKLDKIVFRFGGEAPLFDDFSIAFAAGKITAITGDSGVGKSTLVELIMGLITPLKGATIVDDIEIDEVNLAHWKASIGYVPQDVFLADASMTENIAFGVESKDINLDKVSEAATAANLIEVVNELPNKYDTQLGEGGSLLSGGQRQRIGIARALYRGASVLILDEATSALDNDSQMKILQSIKDLHQSMTIIMITHRKETLAVADEIIELRKVGASVRALHKNPNPLPSVDHPE